MAVLLVAASSLSLGCSSADESTDDTTDEGALENSGDVPPEYMPAFMKALWWFDWLKTNYPQWYKVADRGQADARPWIKDFDVNAKTRWGTYASPVFAHNEIDIEGVGPEDTLKLLASGRSDLYYKNSGPATDCDTGEQVGLALGTSYCWVTFGNLQHMQVVEYTDGADESVLAWYGGQAGEEAYHRWIMRRTETGVHVITEELERGLIPSLSIYSSKMNPALSAGHQLWLQGMHDYLLGGGS